MIDAILSLWKNKGIVTFSYCISVLFSLVIAIPFYSTLIKVSDHTLSLNSLIEDFDYMIFTDALRMYGTTLMPYIPRFIGIFLIYILTYTFLSGGIIDTILHKKLKFTRFILQSYRYWGKTFLLLLYVTIFSILLLIISISLGVISNNLFDVHTHRSILLVQFPALFTFAMGQLYLFLLWDYARVLLVKKQNLRVTDAFTKAMQLTFPNFYPLKNLVSILILGLGGLGIYLLLDYGIGMTSSVTIIVMFIAQQIFIYFRGFMRVLHLKMAGLFISKKPIK
jgi:hypothetical protein